MAKNYTYMGKPDSYNAYAAGNKIYGIGGRSAPTKGKVDKSGYLERDAVVRLKRNALLRRLKAGQSKNYMSPDYLGGNPLV
jgi:hypothetical protein